MRTGHRPAWRRRPQSPAARIAMPLAIPMALGLTLGAVLAFTGGPSSTTIQQADAGASATPGASGAPGPGASGAPGPGASGAPGPGASGAPSPAPTVSASPAPTATATTPATTAAANVSCDIIVPANPLSAKGLASPYQLTGTDGMSPAASGCQMTNAVNLGAFVQATILNPATGALSVYDPLVVTQGSTPAVTPTAPALPANAVVTIDFGFNGTNLYQVGATPSALRQGNCVNGTNGSIFGQVSFCNGINFFQAADQAEREGKLVVPSEGTSPKTGQACPVTRNFNMIDQDPSDNVTTEYLLTGNGQTAQDTTSNAGTWPGATLLSTAATTPLLDLFLDPVLGCTPFQAPDLANNDVPTVPRRWTSYLSARDQPATPALVPENDEMVLVNNAFNAAKTNLYREELGQAPIYQPTTGLAARRMYCQNMVNIQTPFLATNQALLATASSPVAGIGTNLLTFMANRLNMSFTNLACQNFGLTNPVTVTLNGNGAATAATFNTTPQTAQNTAARAMPGQAPRQPAGSGPPEGPWSPRADEPVGM